MLRSISSSDGLMRLGRWYSATAAVVILCLSGCTALQRSDLDLSHVEGLHSDPERTWTQDFRPRDGGGDFFGVSNRARQIERNVGIR
jgi:hypothetical protein